MAKRIWMLLTVLLLSAGALAETANLAKPNTPKPAAGRQVLEFYWLKDIQTPENPKGKWVMEPMFDGGRSHAFRGPRGVILDSVKQPNQVMEKVVRPKQNPPILTSRDMLPNAKANLNSRNQTVVNIEFNARGAKVFARFTRAHVGDFLAVFHDGKLLTAPIINEAIPSGKAEITGFRSLAEAQRLADRINSSAPAGKATTPPVAGCQGVASPCGSR